MAIIALVFYLYLIIGILIGLWFVLRSGHEIDSNLKKASWATRFLLLPGSMVLWPWVLRTVFRSKS